MADLTGKVAIVTGGAQGVGGGIARQMARSGAKVLVADIDLATANKNVGAIVASGGIAAAIEVDVSRYEDLKGMIQESKSLWGRLDFLVNNAFHVAELQVGGVLDLDEDGWESGIHGLITAVYAGCKYAIPAMLESDGGAIVNISSVHGLLVARKSLIYETGKAAIIAMTRQMAVDYGELGIRVNAICPGHIVTETIQENVWKDNPAGLKFFANHYPVKRTGIPEDIGNAAVFLCSDEGSFITGHALPVDGGLTIQLQDDFGVNQVRYYRDNPGIEIPYY